MTTTFFKSLGPGILFAGTAIGVSHLVQSTSAGAEYGYLLVGAVVLANFFKYPFFEFGSRYAHITGQSILHGYNRLHRLALPLFILISLGTMFTVTAGVSSVTAALIAAVFHIETSSGLIYILLLLYAMCISWLWAGKYHFLEKLIKWIALILVVSTVVIFMVAWLEPRQASVAIDTSILLDVKTFYFTIALMGWMPTAVDLSVWNSIWTTEKMKKEGLPYSLANMLVDFRIGYVLSALLALVFLSIGAEALYYQNATLPDTSIGFATGLLDLFYHRTGLLAYVAISISAVCVMISTTITVFDGYSRSMGQAFTILSSKKILNSYHFWLALVAIGGLLVSLVFNNQLKNLVLVATIISFVVAPAVAILNYFVIFHRKETREHSPGKWLKYWALSGIVFLVLCTASFLYFLFG